MGRFHFTSSSLNGVFIVQAKPIVDSRGYFERYFCIDDFKEIGFDKSITQINHSKTIGKGSLRGLHYQNPPFSEVKIIRCLKGKIYDVAVDIRQNSPTFLQYFGIELSEENHKYLYIPEGFAHGFQSLSDESEILYLVSTPFNPEAEGALNAFDPRINIKWKENISHISDKDKNTPFINEDFKGLCI